MLSDQVIITFLLYIYINVVNKEGEDEEITHLRNYWSDSPVRGS